MGGRAGGPVVQLGYDVALTRRRSGVQIPAGPPGTARGAGRRPRGDPRPDPNPFNPPPPGPPVPAAWTPDPERLLDSGRSYNRLSGMVGEAIDVILEITDTIDLVHGRAGNPPGADAAAVEELASKRPRDPAAAVRAVKEAALLLPAITVLLDSLQSKISGINEECISMFDGTSHFFRAISPREAADIIRYGTLGRGKPGKDGGNPTGVAFRFVSLACNIFSALSINKIVIIFDAIAVRRAGVVRVSYSITGASDADVEGIDDPKPVAHGIQSEVRAVRGLPVTQLGPVAVLVLFQMGPIVRRVARRLADYLHVPLYVRNWDYIAGTSKVVMEQPYFPARINTGEDQRKP